MRWAGEVVLPAALLCRQCDPAANAAAGLPAYRLTIQRKNRLEVGPPTKTEFRHHKAP